MKSALRIWGPVAIYVIAISVMSHQPALAPPAGMPDWLAHGIEFSGFAVVLARALAISRGGLTFPAASGTLGLCALMGAIDEFHQSFVPGRQADVRDVLADTAGAAIAIALWMAVRYHRRRARGPSAQASVPEVTLFGRRGCHLCEEAEATLSAVSSDIPIRLTKVDVDDDQLLARRYGAEVPVVTINGRKWAKVRLDEKRLRRKLLSLHQRRAS